MNEKIIKVGVGTLIFNSKQQILLGLRKSAHGKNTWCPPGGHLEYGEEIEEAAAREIAEETGLAVNLLNLQIAGITNDIFVDSGKHYVTVMMKTSQFSGTPEIKEPDKFEKWQWFELSALPGNLFLPVKNFLQKYDIK